MGRVCGSWLNERFRESISAFPVRRGYSAYSHSDDRALWRLDRLARRGMLQSAIAQPCAMFGGQFLHEGLFMMAAAYIFHIAMNHPFIDGNKRAALAAGVTFLDLNGVAIHAPELELADMVLEMITEHRDKQWVAQRLQHFAV